VDAKDGPVPVETVTGGGMEEEEEEEEEEEGMAKLRDYMSIFELEESSDEEEDGDGDGVVVLDGDDEGLLYGGGGFTNPSDMGEDGNLLGVNSRDGEGEGGREKFVELTRRILDDLDVASVSG
jgi:hypothetical protein